MIVIIFGLIILFNLNNHVLGDEYDTIRTEEETRHKDVLSKLVKAAVSGALISLFPRVTNQEQTEAEKLIAECSPLLDPPLPDTLEQLETKICAVHRARGQKILAYIRKRHPTHLITQITVRLAITGLGRTHDTICKDAESRINFVNNASVINQYIVGLSAAKNRFIDSSLVILHTNTTATKLAILCCSYWSLKAGLINSCSTPESKHYYASGLTKYDSDAAKYLCLHHSDGSKACANLVIPPPPNNVTRFSSVTLAIIESVARITHIAL